MTKTEIQYREAWERVKAGKPQIVDKHMPINELNTIALEAGKKEGSLRRVNHEKLCDEITEYEVDETELQQCIRLKKQYSVEKDENEVLWQNALARELIMMKRLLDLEMEIKRLKQKYPGIIFELEDLNND